MILQVGMINVVVRKTLAALSLLFIVGGSIVGVVLGGGDPRTGVILGAAIGFGVGLLFTVILWIVGSVIMIFLNMIFDWDDSQ
jgi:hypothetical protein